MIEFAALTKIYGQFEAVKPLTMTIPAGEVFGFLGPNGAGKTTTIRMMMGILVPSTGKVMINGLDCHLQRASVMHQVGYLPDNPLFYDYLRGAEILSFVAEMHGMKRRAALTRAEQLLEEFDLTEARGEYASNYSLGMKKKLGLACALIHNPSVLILDEPINGLDPRASRDVQDRLRRIAAEGRTIFVSTHQLDIADKLCSRIGIIDKGSMVAIGSPEELKSQGTPGNSLEDIFFAVTHNVGAAESDDGAVN